MLNILVYAIPGLAFLVLIHELGHLFVARWCGITVEAFSIFFGRPIYSVQWKGIDWRIGWIPFGGYCKMKGQEDFKKAQESDDPDDFYNRPSWARLYTVLGGPVFNILLGFLLIISLTYTDEVLITGNAPIIIYPNTELPLQNQDIIRAVDGEKVSSWNEVNEYLLKGIHKDKQILEVERAGQRVQVAYSFDKEKRLEHNLGFNIPQALIILDVHKSIVYGQSKDQKVLEKKNPVWGSGIKRGDLIVALNGEFVYSVPQLSEVLNANNTEQELIVLELGDSFSDTILGINGESGYTYNTTLLTQTKHTLLFEGHSGQYTKEIPLKRIRFTPVSISQKDEQTQASESKKYIGVQIATQVMPAIRNHQYYKNYSFTEAFQVGTQRTWDLMIMAITQFKLLTQLSSDTVRKNLAGPLGIIKVIGEQGAKGFRNYLSMLALFSLFLGIFNLLPIPAVDGGHVVLSLFEIIRRKPLSLQVVQRIQVIGIVIVVSIAILVTINDILRWVKG